MKLLVTGGAGFIGSNFIRYWLKKYSKDKVISLDKLTYAGNLSCDSNVVYKAIKGVDYVVHFAAETHVDRSIVNPNVFVRTNVMGTNVLLEASIKHKIKRFHHISTDEVFGSLSLESKKKFSEKTKYFPRSVYAASKAASDHLVLAYFATYGLPVTITNSSNNFGPYQDPEKFIPRMITNLIDDKPVSIYGDGKNIRDWIYVMDHVRAIDIVLSKGRIGETYVLGGLTKDINNLEVAVKLLNLFGKDKSFIKFVRDRKGHDRRYAIDWRKIKKEVGWEPEYNFETWIKKTVEWYRQNEWWWRPLKKRAEKLYEKTGQK